MAIGSSVDSHEKELRARFGEILTLAELADLLRYPSSQAFLKARARGQVLVPIFRFPKRRGWFSTTRAVAQYLDQIESKHTELQRDW